MQGLPLFVGRRNGWMHTALLIAAPLVLMLTILSQTVLGQNTFVITEGDQVIVHKTSTEDPAVALEEAGIQVDPHEYRTYRSKDNTYEIHVVRDDMVVVMNCGEKMYVAVEDATVGALLQRAGVPTGDGYEISCGLDENVVDGMTITVNCLLAPQGDSAENEVIINNGVAVLPSGEVVSCYDLESF